MIISPDKKGTLDAPTMALLKEVKTDIAIVPMNAFSDFEFNEELLKLDKWVLADYSELGANDYDRSETLLFGRNSERFKRTDSVEFKKFDEFVKNNPPIVYFKRELLKNDFIGNVHPIDFPCFHPIEQIQTKEQFEKRGIEVFFYWGHSHESRRALHGNIFLNSAQKGYGVIDNFYHIERGMTEYKKVWVTIQTPHYARIPMEQVVFINGHAKLSVSMPGAGAKCFRMAESSINSVMVMQDDKMQYSFPWIDGVNCIQSPLSNEHAEIRGLKNQWVVIEAIEKALSNHNLYDIYLQGVENCDKYRVDRYCKEYIEPLINQYK